jgi:hypothetical protein
MSDNWHGHGSPGTALHRSARRLAFDVEPFPLILPKGDRLNGDARARAERLLLMCPLEILNIALMLFSGRPSFKGSEILALSCFEIFFL